MSFSHKRNLTTFPFGKTLEFDFVFLSGKLDGYGNDNQGEIGAFPFSQSMPNDENDELRQQLKHMGGSKCFPQFQRSKTVNLSLSVKIGHSKAKWSALC